MGFQVKLKKLAVTGGLSCGKSSVCRILKKLGAYVVSADNIVHQLLSSDTNLGQEIVCLLGPDILVNDLLDRSRIAKLVFKDQDRLTALEAIIHPAVYREINKEYQTQKKLPAPPPLFVAEIPLLFESGGQMYFDATLTVVSEEKTCMKRFKKMTRYGDREFHQRMARQLPVLEKAELADYVIMNNGSLSELKKKTENYYKMLIEEMNLSQ